MKIFKFISWLDCLHWLWLALAAPFLLFPSPKRIPAMLVVPMLWLLHLIKIKWEKRTANRQIRLGGNDQPSTVLTAQSSFPITALNTPLLLLFCMVLVSLWATFDINISLSKISGIVLGIGILYAFAREGQTLRGWWLGFLLFLVVGIGIATVGLLGTNWITKISILTPIVSRLAPRIIGLPGVEEGFHPNYVAGALLWVIPSFFILSWLLLNRAKKVRNLIGRSKANILIMLAIGATVWIFAVFILTQSRGGYIGLTLTLLPLALIAIPRRWRWYSLIFLLLVTVVLGFLVASHWEAVVTSLLGKDQFADPALSLDSFDIRLEIWSRAIYGIQDFPLTGMGMGTFRKVMPALYPLFKIAQNVDIGHAHNEFLQAALDLGIPGLVGFISLYIVAFWMLIRTWKYVLLNLNADSRKQRTEIAPSKSRRWASVLDTTPFTNVYLAQMIVLGLGGGLLAHLLWGLTDAMALGARPAFPFWILLGLISGLHQHTQEHRGRMHN